MCPPAPARSPAADAPDRCVWSAAPPCAAPSPKAPAAQSSPPLPFSPANQSPKRITSPRHWESRARVTTSGGWYYLSLSILFWAAHMLTTAEECDIWLSAEPEEALK